MNKHNEWNEVKKVTHSQNRNLGIKVRDIYWTKIGHNIGSEEFGKGGSFARPVIIIRKLTHDLFIGIPLTSSIRNDDYFHHFQYNNRSNGIVDNSAMILQFKTFSKKRLMNKAGVINQQDFKEILKKSRNLFL